MALSVYFKTYFIVEEIRESIVQIVNKMSNLAHLYFNMCRFISEGVPRDPGSGTYFFGTKFKMADLD